MKLKFRIYCLLLTSLIEAGAIRLIYFHLRHFLYSIPVNLSQIFENRPHAFDALQKVTFVYGDDTGNAHDLIELTPRDEAIVIETRKGC